MFYGNTVLDATVNPSPQRLTPEQRAFYVEEGYLCLRGALPPDLLALSTHVLQKWMDETAQEWLAKGLIRDLGEHLSFAERLGTLWRAAGRPTYIRSPRRDLVSPEMYRILVHPSLLAIAEDLLGTDELSVHGVFNGRPKLPDQKWTDTPWHQDAQYYRDAEHNHVVSMWYPLQRVTEENSCLQVAPRCQNGVLYEGFIDEETGFLGLSREDRDRLKGVSVEMDPGDVLCFPQKTPHRALPNRSDRVRWSIDIRYEATANATVSGKADGFIARSPKEPTAILSCEAWLAKWRDRPAGAY